MTVWAAAWAFLKTGVGKVLAGLVALAGIIAYAFLRGHAKGRQAQTDKDAAAVQASEHKAASAQTQQDVYQAANEAAAAVPQPKTPDVVKRDDFNNDF